MTISTRMVANNCNQPTGAAQSIRTRSPETPDHQLLRYLARSSCKHPTRFSNITPKLSRLGPSGHLSPVQTAARLSQTDPETASITPISDLLESKDVHEIRDRPVSDVSFLSSCVLCKAASDRMRSLPILEAAAAAEKQYGALAAVAAIQASELCLRCSRCCCV